MKAEITIPTSLSEITLGQYQNFLKVAEGLEGDMLAHRTVNILCDVRLSDVMMLRQTDVKQIAQEINELFTLEQELQTNFTLKGANSKSIDEPIEIDFGFIPVLEDISFGEYVDLDKYINDWDSMHKAMAVLFRPISKKGKSKYLIHDYEGASGFEDLMRFMPLDIALGAVVFFYRIANELLKATRLYLLQEVEKMTSHKSHNSTNNGDGTTASTPSLKAMLEHLTKLPEFQLPKLLHI